MSWTTKKPITEGWKYWRKDSSHISTPVFVEYMPFRKFFLVKFIDNECRYGFDEIGGEWWDAPVPEPGETFSVEEIRPVIESVLKDYVSQLTDLVINRLDFIGYRHRAATERAKG